MASTIPESRVSSTEPSVMEKPTDIELDKEQAEVTPDSLENARAVEHAKEEQVDFKRPLTGVKWFLFCIGLYLAALLYGLDTTIAADVQAPVLETLGEIEKLTWVGVGFPMASVATILLIGVFYGLFETKWLTLGSIVLFELGSAVCGAAPTMNALIIGRVIAGVGGAGMYLGGLNYLTVFTTLKERPIYMALLGLSWGCGCILGPVIGGAFAVSSATWRWAFYINLVLGAVTAPIYIMLFPRHQPQPTLTTWDKFNKIDWVGAFLVAATFTLFLVTLSISGITKAWSSGESIALWTVLGVVLLALIVQQAFSIFTSPIHRIYPVQFLSRRSMILFYIGTACSATALFVPTYYIPLFFQFTKNDTAIMAAVRLLPFICVNIAFTMLSGGLLPVIGYYMPFYVLGGTFTLIGGALAYTVNINTSTSTIYGYTVLIAIGSGWCNQIAYSLAAAKVQPHELPAAIGFMNVAQLGSIALALGIGGSVFQNSGFANLSNALAGYGYSEADLRGALAGVQSVILLSAPDKVRELALEAIVLTISRLYALVIAAGALGLIAGLAMKRERLSLEMSAGG